MIVTKLLRRQSTRASPARHDFVSLPCTNNQVRPAGKQNWKITTTGESSPFRFNSFQRRGFLGQKSSRIDLEKKSQLNGLLQGINRDELKSSSFYSNNYNGNIDTPSSLWIAAQANTKYSSAEDHIARCENNIAAYLKSNNFCDREDIKELMETYANTDGNLVILCGGPSIGKTLLLNVIASNSATNRERLYVMVDGRSAGKTPDLFGDISKAFERNNLISQELKGRVIEAMFKVISKVVGKVVSNILPDLDVSGGALAIENVIKSRSISDVDGLNYFVDAIINDGKSITIIIDEANKYFNVDTSAPTTNALLDCLIKLSKQNQKLSVILACSEFTFPYQMSKLKINTAHVRKVVALHEISPNKMLQLLVDKLEMGEELALALISFYGGSLLHIQNALTELSIKKNSYVMSVPGFAMLNLYKAEARAKDKNVQEEFEKVLMLLSVQGFARIDQNSIVAEILVEQNVAAFLLSGTRYEGVSTKIRQPNQDGLIPVLQIVRIAIHIFLKKKVRR